MDLHMMVAIVVETRITTARIPIITLIAIISVMKNES